MYRGILVSGVFAAILALFAPFVAHADSAKRLGRFNDWEGYSYADKAGKVCYAASLPKRSLGAPKGRAETYVSVTHRPKEKAFDVVSVTAGFPFKKGAAAEVDISGAKFEMFTDGDTAWTRNDKAVVQAMLKGKSLIVHGVPAKGEAVSDTYSLAGFSQAYGEINKACGVK